ncbi:MAG: thioredoxin domain-containing protein [Planctomycetes bacterium]|nr:thioredoxin domain-containing protein [Planctomycetota bacterium]
MSGRTKVLAGLLAVLSLGAIGVSLYLTWSSWQTEAIAGCSGDGTVDCDAVLASHWSQWLGMPVSLFGSITYVGILAVCWPAAKHPGGKACSGLLALSLLAAGAAVWFIAVQAVFLQSFCLYCLSVHACGLSIAGITLLLIRGSTREVDYDQMRALLGVNEPAEPSSPSPSGEGFYPLIATGVAATGLALLMGGQLLFSPEGLVVESLAEKGSFSVEQEELEDQTFELIAVDGEATDEVTENNIAEEDFDDVDLEDLFGAEARETSGPRRLFFLGLQRTLDLSDYPMLGSPNAPLVFVEMLDYTCRHCRRLHPYVESALKRHGDQVAFVIHHVPLSSRCNPHLTKYHPSTKDACDYTRLAMGVWQLAPEEFPAFHNWLMESEKPPPIFEARKRALDIAGEAVLIDDSLKANLQRKITEQCGVLQRLKLGLPVLFTEQNIIKGIPESSKEWIEFIEGQLER